MTAAQASARAHNCVPGTGVDEDETKSTTAPFFALVNCIKAFLKITSRQLHHFLTRGSVSVLKTARESGKGRADGAKQAARDHIFAAHGSVVRAREATAGKEEDCRITYIIVVREGSCSLPARHRILRCGAEKRKGKKRAEKRRGTKSVFPRVASF